MFQKRYVLILLFLFSCHSFAQQKTTAAVMNLKAEGVSESESRIITARLRVELFKTDKFAIVERERMADILQEQGFQLSGCTTDECAVEAGKLLGVKLMVAGEVGKMEEMYTLTIRLIDVQSGKILRVASEDCSCAIGEFLTSSVRRIAYKLIGEKPPADIRAKEDQMSSREKPELDLWRGRHFGMAFNPALLLAGMGYNVLYLSGGLSLFNLAPHGEINLPVYYRNYKSENDRLLTVDLEYRLFFSKSKHRFFTSIGMRYARLMGKKESNDSQRINIDKYGAFFGIGWRYFSKIGIYWGSGLILGTYFTDDSDRIKGAFLDQGKFLFDFELLKIGYAF